MTKEYIQFRLQNCETLQELVICWDYFKENIKNEDKNYLIEVKNVLKEYLSIKDLEVYQSLFIQKDCRNIENELSLSLPEKNRAIALKIKKLKYYGAI